MPLCSLFIYNTLYHHFLKTECGKQGYRTNVDSVYNMGIKYKRVKEE